MLSDHLDKHFRVQGRATISLNWLWRRAVRPCQKSNAQSFPAATLKAGVKSQPLWRVAHVKRAKAEEHNAFLASPGLTSHGVKWLPNWLFWNSHGYGWCRPHLLAVDKVQSEEDFWPSNVPLYKEYKSIVHYVNPKKPSSRKLKSINSSGSQ